MSVIITGVTELRGALAAMAARQTAMTGTALGKCAHLLEREVKVALSMTSASGEEKRDTKGRFAKRGSTSSPPGEPPFLRSGDLRRSIQVDGPTPEAGGAWAAKVGPTVIYGRIQELGGVTGVNGSTTLPARPYMAPSLEKVTPQMYEVMKSAWAAALRG